MLRDLAGPMGHRLTAGRRVLAGEIPAEPLAWPQEITRELSSV
jgi:hypothetical protein